MRAGLTVSIVAHAAILGIGFIAFPEARTLQAANIEALPVDLVTAADVTDLLQGDKKSEVPPKETPQPKPVVQAETPAPAPAEKPAPKPIEAAPAPSPPPAPPPAPEPPKPEPPKPEPPKPAPEPKPAEVAALPDPTPAEEPQPAAVPEPAIPRPRPTPPKQVAAPKPAPAHRPTEIAPEKPKPEFNPDDIAALLNKQEPAGGGDPVPATEPQTLGSIDGHAGAAMTQSEIDALKSRLYRCWNPPVAVREAAALVIEVRITLLPDGSLSGQPTIVGVGQASDPLAQVAAEAAIRAVVQCAPFGDILKPENYVLWNQIDFVFDPREMLGG